MQDLRWQTFLNANASGMSVAAPVGLHGETLLSPALNRLTLGDASIATGAVTRATANGTLVLPDTDGQQALALNRDPYTTGVGYQARLPVGSATINAGVDIYGGRNIKGIALSTSAVLAGAQAGAAVGLTLITRAEASPTSTVRASPEGDAQVLAVYKTEVMPVIAVGVSGATLHAGGGFRLVGIRGRAIEYEKFVDIDVLGEAMRKQNVWWQSLREMGQAIGVIKGMRLPQAGKLSENEALASTLEVGEKLTWVRTGGLIFGVNAGGMGARAGLTIKLDGQTSMSLERPDEDTLQLSVSHVKSRGLSISADFPLLAEAYHSRGVGLAQRLVFRFKAADPGAEAALRAALNGSMPINLGAPTSVDGEMADTFMGLVADKDKRLPKGVESVSIEAAEEHVVSSGFAGLRPLALSKHLHGVAHQRSTSRRQRVVATGSAALTERGLASSKQTEFFRLAREHTASATLQMLPTPTAESGVGNPTFVGVHAVLTFDQARSGQGSRQKLSHHLNKKLGHAIARQEPIGSGNSYKLTLTRLFRPQDLARLAAMEPAAVQRAATASQLKPAAGIALVKSLAGLSPVAQGEKLVAFIAAHRSRGVGTLQQLLGEDIEPLEVEVESGAYDKAFAKAVDISIRLAGLTDGSQTKREIKRLERLQVKVASIAQDLAADNIFRALDEEAFRYGLTVVNKLIDDLGATRAVAIAGMAEREAAKSLGSSKAAAEPDTAAAAAEPDKAAAAAEPDQAAAAAEPDQAAAAAELDKAAAAAELDKAAATAELDKAAA